jgi:hemerythrin superfamily protein
MRAIKLITTKGAWNMPDALEMLQEDHEKVKGLFEQFEEAEDSAAKAQIVQTALKELEIHATLEEEIFYPAVRETDDDEEHEDMMDEALEEHHVAKMLIAELQDMAPDDERYDAKFTVLAESVKHHIEEEESELLPKAEKEELDLESLGEQMMERKQQLITAETIGRGRSRKAQSRGRGRTTAKPGTRKKRPAVQAGSSRGRKH